jgi:hypothetical protein
MPLINCPHCGERTFTISGWADLDRCPSCDKPLARSRADRGALSRAAIKARNEAQRITRTGGRSQAEPPGPEAEPDVWSPRPTRRMRRA